MKWVNLADREPPNDGETKIIVRRVSDKSVSFGLIFYLTHETPRRWTLWNPKENVRLTSSNFSDYEWLDESEELTDREANFLYALELRKQELELIYGRDWKEKLKSIIG